MIETSARRHPAVSLHTLPALLLSLCTLAAPAAAELRIAEALSAPASDWNGDGLIDFKTDEWVEIVNTGPDVEVLDGVFLRDGTGDAYHYGFTGTLAPGAVLLVDGQDAVDWQAANDAGSSGLSLNNSGDTLELWRDVALPRVLEAIDVVVIPAHAAGADRAYGLDPVSGLFQLYDALNPYGGDLVPGGTGCEPSPGRPNSCGTGVPARSDRWGSMKAAYGVR